MDGCLDGRKDEGTFGWMESWMDERMDGPSDGWKIRWMDGWMNGWTGINRFMYSYMSE